LGGGGPLGQALELDATDGALQFGEAEVGAEALVQPAEAQGVFTPLDRLMGVAVVCEGPDGITEIDAMGGHHAALTSGGELLVLAEAPGSRMTEAGKGLTLGRAPWGLGAGLSHGDDLCTCQLKDKGISAGPPPRRLSAQGAAD
jgi:hypothetical protein